MFAEPFVSCWILRGSFAALALGSVAHGQGYKLAGPFPPGPGGGDASAMRVSSDGSRVVYRADQETPGDFELFSVTSDGSGVPVKLNGPLVEQGDVDSTGFALSPDGAWVVHRAAQESLDSRLYSARADGSTAPVRLDDPPAELGSPPRFAITSDSSRLVYVGQGPEGRTLFSVPIDGSGAAVELDGPGVFLPGLTIPFQLASGGRVVFVGIVSGASRLHSVPADGSSPPIVLSPLTTSGGVISPDGSQAVFSTSAASQLWRVPTDGSASATLLTPTAFPVIFEERVSPGGAWLVFRAGTFSQLDVYGVPMDASAPPIRLNPVLAAGRTVSQFSITADGLRVLYLADQALDETYELWSAPIDGSAASVRLNSALVSGGDVAGLVDVERVNANERMVYVADQDVNDQTELYSVPADGSGAVLKLNSPLPSQADVVTFSDSTFSPKRPFGDDPTRVVFALATFDGDDTLTELYVVPIDASAAPVKLSGTLVPGGDVSASQGWGFTTHPQLAGERVVFFADKDTDTSIELYSTPLDAGPGLFGLSGPMSPGLAGSRFHQISFTPDGARTLYVLELAASVGELYSVPTDGSDSPVRLHEPLPEFEWVEGYLVSSDGARVVFQVFHSGTPSEQSSTLFSAPTDGSSPAVAFEPPLAFDTDSRAGEYALSADGAYVVMGGLDERLYRAPIDASAAGVPLMTAPSSPSQELRAFALATDGSMVVFAQDRDTLGVVELYAVPLDGSAPPTKLNPPLVANGDVGFLGVREFVVLVSPDSARVVYVADQELDESYELFSVPITGGAAIKLNGVLTAGGDVLTTPASAKPVIVPGGAHVVYLADQEVDGRDELFSAPLAGGGSVKLNPTPVAGGEVDAFGKLRFTPDGQRVVFLGDLLVNEQLEVFSAPIPGGTAVRLNGELVAGGDVAGSGASPVLSPDGAWVTYLADQVVDNEPELFSRRVDGSGSVRRLYARPQTGPMVSFGISTDSRRVTFIGDPLEDQRFELFEVPIGGGPVLRLNRPLVPRGDITGFTPTPDGELVVHHGDQDTDQMEELFASWLAAPPHRTASPPSGSRTASAPPP